MSAEETNRYCERLGIRAPRIEDHLSGGHPPKLFHLMILALLERGGPMGLEEIAGRLAAAGVRSPIGDLGQSLKKAWHGLAPVLRDPDGKFRLDLDSAELRGFLDLQGLRPPYVPESPPPIAVDLPEPPGDDVPLTPAEVEAAFRNRVLYSVSPSRVVSAVLDAFDKPMAFEEVDRYLAQLTRCGPQRPRRWMTDLLAQDADGRFVLNRQSPALGAMRNRIRRMAYPVLRRKAQQELWAREAQRRAAEREAEERIQELRASKLRRAVVRVFPRPSDPRAVAVLDGNRHTIRTFLGDGISSVPEVLASFELLVGLKIRETLYAFSLDPEWLKLVELSAQKTRTLNRAGRKLVITPELLIRSSTGISRPFGDPRRTARYLAEGDERKLARRLEDDVKALYAYYRYGVLHGCVRLRWGILDEMIRVDWRIPGDLSLYKIIQRAKAEGRRIQIVCGSAPGWSDPWSRARTFEIVDIDSYRVFLKDRGLLFSIPRYEVQAVRVVEEDPIPKVEDPPSASTGEKGLG